MVDTIYKIIEDCEVKKVGERQYEFTASTSDVDRDGEVIEAGGWDLKSFKKNPVVLWAHNHYGPPIGKALWIKADEKGLIAKTQFAPDDFSQQIFDLFKGGFMKAFSVGFIPKEWTDGDGSKTPRRTYNKSELLEYSAVPVPANPNALVMALEKGVITEETKEKLENMKVPDPEEAETDDQKKAREEKEAKEAADKKQKEEQQSNIDDMMAEIEQKDAEIKALGEELVKVRYDLYMSLKNPRDKAVSEIAGKDLIKTINEGIAGAIRDVTGKVS